MEIKEIKTMCTNEIELIVNIELVPVKTGYAIVSLKRDRSLSLDEEVTIDTLQLPESHNGIPITTIKCICKDKNDDYSVGNFYTAVQNLILPDSIVKVENRAFLGTCIHNVQWSKNCDTIPEKAFSFSSLETLTNTMNVKIIRRGAFKDCVDLITIESETMNNCKRIESEAFRDDINIKEFTWPDKCENVPEYCFASCERLSVLKNISRIKSISGYAFSNTGFKKFVMGEECLLLGPGSFNHCKNLKEFVFNNSCCMIDTDCFSECTNLSDVKNTSHLIKIGSYAFAECKNLTSFIWPEGCPNIPMCCFDGSGIENIIWPSTVLNFEKTAFENTKIKEFDLSHSIVLNFDKSKFPENSIIKYPYYM